MGAACCGSDFRGLLWHCAIALGIVAEAYLVLKVRGSAAGREAVALAACSILLTRLLGPAFSLLRLPSE